MGISDGAQVQGALKSRKLEDEGIAGHPFSRGGDHAGIAHRVALVGAGCNAEAHARALRSVKNAELVAVCDRVPGRAQAFAREFGVPHAYESLEIMLAAEKLDAVHILLPPDLHYVTARRSLDAGVNVFLESPLSERADLCDALLECAAEKGLRLGVDHPFLFAEPYERLRRDVCAGALGRIDDVTITWHRPLPQVMKGPFDSWMLRNPRNVLLEIGAHSVVHLLDLVGEPEELQVQPDNPVELPAGGRFYRRWQVSARNGPMAVEMRFSFVPGFPEHTIHVRGSLAAATVDLERNTYLLHHHRRAEQFLDNFFMTSREAASLKWQARRALLRSALGALNLRDRGNPCEAGVAGAMDAFYAAPDRPLDVRVGGRLGAQAVQLCELMGRVAVLPEVGYERAADADAARIRGRSAKKPRILVLGGTGFVGREVVRQLGEAGLRARLLVRDAAALPRRVRESSMECIAGDLTNRDGLRRAMEGVDCVFHLARAHATSWAEYQELEVEATRRVAECALEAGVKRLVYTGAIESYYTGLWARTITEHTPLDPHIERRNPYARAKAASEALLMRMHHEAGLPAVIFRPGIVIGRGGTPFPRGVGNWWFDAVCLTWGKGKNKLPLVLVDDVASALVAAFDMPELDGRSFNLVGEPFLSAQEYLDELDRCGGMRIERHATSIPGSYLAGLVKWAVKSAVGSRDQSWPSHREWACRAQRAKFDCSAARTSLGWKPEQDREEFVRRGIEEPLLEWMR